MLSLMTSCMSQELITPLKCIVQIGRSAIKEARQASIIKKTQLIVNTAEFIMSSVKCNMDGDILDKGIFNAALEP